MRGQRAYRAGRYQGGGLVRPLAPYRQSRLGQELPIETFDVTQEQDVSDSEASSFGTWWSRFKAIWPAFLAMRDEIADHRQRWNDAASSAYAAGDIEGFRAAKLRVTEMDKLESSRLDAESYVTRFKSAWDAMAEYLKSAGRWFGLQGYRMGLGLPPLILAVSIPAAIAAIAYVVTTYYRVREQLDLDRVMLDSVERGSLTAEQAATLRQGGFGSTPGPLEGLMRGGLGGFGTLALLIGGGFVLLSAFGGRRS